nr:helix-turn-helix transcriptional regulator [uncultured Chitinophaga sp.]
MYAQGLSINQIVENVFVAPDTIKYYRRRIFKRLEVSNIADALAHLPHFSFLHQLAHRINGFIDGRTYQTDAHLAYRCNIISNITQPSLVPGSSTCVTLYTNCSILSDS